MIRNWKTLTLYSLLTATATYVPQPVFAGGIDKKEKEKDPAIEKLKEEIKAEFKAFSDRVISLEKKNTADKEALSAQMSKLETTLLSKLEITVLNALVNVGNDVTSIKKTIEDVKGEMKTIQSEQYKQKLTLDHHKMLIEELQKKKFVAESSPIPQIPAVDKAKLDEINSRLSAIQDALAKGVQTKTRDSMSLPNGAPVSPMGRVVLLNLYSDEVTFMINGTVHRVPPRSQKVLENFPVGTMNYEVSTVRFGLLQRQVTDVANGETFTLTAR